MIQFQRLLDACKATEELPLGCFRMDVVFCGTAGCVIGNYNALTGRAPSRFGFKDSSSTPVDDWEFFGISENEYHWLFAVGPGFHLLTSYRFLDAVTREQALARLRKFIYYKLHKHEMCYSEKYSVREEARRAEGNQGFAARAKVESARHALTA